MDISNVNEHSLGTINQNEVEKPADKSGGFSGFSVGLSKNDSDDRSVRDALTKSLETPKETHGKTLFDRSVTMTESPAMKETNPAEGFEIMENEFTNGVSRNVQEAAQNVQQTGTQGVADDFDIIDDDIKGENDKTNVVQDHQDQHEVDDHDVFDFVNSYRSLKPHSSSVLATVGRFFQAIGLFLRSFVSDVPVDANADAAFVRTDANHTDDVGGDRREPVAYSNRTIGLAMGLKGEVLVKPFKEGLYPKNGTPSLSDIRQNPDLQDCWFLSSVTSLLSAKGPQCIKDMIEHHDGDDFAIVHFKQESFKVPYGELTDRDGNVSVSNSAPWVRLLETAMQMHFIKECRANGGGLLRMDERDSRAGLNAIFGTGYEYNPPKADAKHKEVLTDLKARLNAHHPVTLGHKRGFLQLFDFVATGHAVTLLDVDPEKKEVTIMDPYGRILVKDSGFINRCSVFTAD